MSKERVVFITGGARGIGRAVAERFLDGGAAVMLADLDAGRGRATAAALGRRGEVSFVAVDVSHEGSVRNALRTTLRRHGRLDVLVNNAGIIDAATGFDSRAWRRVLGVNLSGAFFCAKHAAPALRKTGGCIVNVASTRALMSEPDTQAYSASKGGLVALTHSLALTLAPRVRVNCVSPGWIHTRGGRLRPADHRQHPVGRVGAPADVAGLAFFLASPEAGFITGQNFVADGGMTRKMIYAE